MTTLRMDNVLVVEDLEAAIAFFAELGLDPVIFPSHHGGFLGGEYGQTGDPEAFAAALRHVFAGA